MDEKRFTLVIEATLFTESAKLVGPIDECQTPKLVTESKKITKLELTADELSVLTELTHSIGSVIGEDLRHKLERMRFQVEVARQAAKPESEEVKDVRSIFS